MTAKRTASGESGLPSAPTSPPSPAAARTLGSRLLNLGLLFVAVFAIMYWNDFKQRGSKQSTQESTDQAAIQIVQNGQHVSPKSLDQPTTKPDQQHTIQAPPAQGVVPSQAEVSEIRIATWNIEWLGKPEDRSGPAKNIAQDPEDLADVIYESRASLVALQEIVTRVVGTPLRSREIEGVLESLKKRTTATWDYVLFPGRQDGDQLTGVIWNTKVLSAVKTDGSAWSQPKDVPWALPIPDGRSSKGKALWHRLPHAMKFSTGDKKTDFVVIVLHMKADYQGDFAEHRKEEAQALIQAIPQVRKVWNDQDIIILGDTNFVQDVEPGATLLVQANFNDLNGGKSQTHWRGGTMDRIFTPKNQPEFETSRFDVVSDNYLKKRKIKPEEFKRRYSDHYLTVATFKSMKDDD